MWDEEKIVAAGISNRVIQKISANDANGGRVRACAAFAAANSAASKRGISLLVRRRP
jgi:hypothetical protein